MNAHVLCLVTKRCVAYSQRGLHFLKRLKRGFHLMAWIVSITPFVLNTFKTIEKIRATHWLPCNRLDHLKKQEARGRQHKSLCPTTSGTNFGEKDER